MASATVMEDLLKFNWVRWHVKLRKDSKSRWNPQCRCAERSQAGSGSRTFWKSMESERRFSSLRDRYEEEALAVAEVEETTAVRPRVKLL